MQPPSNKITVLKSSTDFQRLSRTGKRWSCASFIFQAAKSETPCRVGYTASRKVGNAPVRNRAKRRLRELVRAYLAGRDGFDIVIVAKTAAATQDFTQMKADFEKGLRALGVIV